MIRPDLFKQERFLCIVLLLLFSVTSVWASKQEYVKKKEWTKSFSVDNRDQLDVENTFGNIIISYGTKNEVKFRVVVEAKSSNEERAVAMVDRVKIDLKKSGTRVSGSTSLSPSNWNGQGNESFTINYYVEVPKGFTLGLSQKYGNITLPAENAGKCTLTAKYGNITGGNFSGDIVIESKYGNVDLGNVVNGSFDLAYCGRAVLEKVKQLTVDSRYSNMELSSAESLTYDGKYGNINIEVLNQGTILLRYGNGKIGKVQKDLIINELSYSTVTVQELSSGFSKVYANARYGNLNLNLLPTASFSVEANDLKYGNCSVKGFDALKRLTSSSGNDFDSRREKEDKTKVRLQVNGGGSHRIVFDGNNYSNLKIQAK